MRFGIREKLNFSILIAVFVVLAAIVSFFSSNIRRQTKEDAFHLRDNIAKEISKDATALLNIDLGFTRSLASSYEGYRGQSKSNLKKMYKQFLKQGIVHNPNYLAFWISLELNEVDPTYTKETGRVTWLYDRLSGEMMFRTEYRDTSLNSLSPQYQQIKKDKKESLINPYYYKPLYTGATIDSLLEATVGVPVIAGGEVVGLAGIDFTLQELQKLTNHVNLKFTADPIIFANNGTIVCHPDSSMIGQNLKLYDNFSASGINVLDSIANGKSFSYSYRMDDGNLYYFTFAPIQIGNSTTPWSACVSVPYKEVLSKAKMVFLRSMLIGFAGLLLLGLIVFILSSNIIKPIEATTKILTQLSRGQIGVTKELKASSNDEIALMEQAMITLNNRFKSITEFASEIGHGNLSAAYPYSSEEDILGKKLTRMQENLVKLDEEGKTLDWLKSGINGLNEQVRGDRELRDLAKIMISYVAKYVDVQVGALYYTADNKDKLIYCAGYAFSKRKELVNTIDFGEGLVGQCALEQEMIILTDPPKGYLPVKSATGSANPKNIIVLPCLYDTKTIGVIELASFKEIDDNQIEFLSNATQSIAIGLNTAIAKEKMKTLLAKTLEQKEELQAQEEELREANQGLEKQAETLKKSEANLQAQQEELRVTNQELEKNAQMLEEQTEKINEKNHQLEITRKEIEKKAIDLAQASKYKSEFLANMSHELRTPLNSMLILSQSLADNSSDNLNADEVESAQIIYDSGKDLLNLINEVLDLSKIEAGKMDVNFENVDLQALAQNMQSLFKASIESKGLNFSVDLMPDIPTELFTDQLRVQQIIKNLLSNSVKFTSEGGINIIFSKPSPSTKFIRSDLNADNCISISVKDTGIGISPDKQKLIFEAFQQEDGSTSRKYGGTGLGLSISRELAVILGGELQLQSEVNKGSVFSLFLPLSNEQANPSITEHQPTTEHHVTQVNTKTDTIDKQVAESPNRENQEYIPDDRNNIDDKNKLVLIIEDDPKFAKILLDQCHKKGLYGIAAETGESGLLLASQHLPSAIILDIKLPGIDGWKVLESLKQDPKTRHIPVHMMSAMEENIEAYQKGAIGYLTKPVSTQDLQDAFVRIESFFEPSVKHLLLVEDDTQMRKTIQKVIKGKDVEISAVSTGADCLNELSKNSFDCLVLDLGLPDMDGFELLKQIKDAHNQHIPPIIVYTGKDLTKEENHELQKYTKSIIIKGVRSEERLLDETALFLHRVVEDLSVNQQKIIKNLYDKDLLFKDKKILIVDDDMRNVFALTRVFEDKGVLVKKAENGKKALMTLEKDDSFDLILMDIMMPEMDGYEAMKEIRKLSKFKDIPIIALTAKAMKEDKQKCLDAGASDYITKPLDIAKLMSLLRIWLFK
ncbi:MAG: response regulator [Bacteroidales bacterium]|nr:response regulator [Bacteroidales bacterium]